MLCAPLDWQYAELPSSASDAVLCSVLVRKMWVIETNRKKKEKKKRYNTVNPLINAPFFLTPPSIKPPPKKSNLFYKRLALLNAPF